MDLTVITATRQRPSHLAQCLSQFQIQSSHGIASEQIVVSDGVDRHARGIAGQWGARFCEVPQPLGNAGAGAKDLGVREALGDYVCFWDDDNVYYPHALATLFAAVQGADIGVVRIQHRFRTRPGFVVLPRVWGGEFRKGDVDTMCVCVRRSLALKELWADGLPPPGTDWRWLRRLQRYQPVIRFVPVIIGVHL
ncbi:glycosyltransferase family 2 protein [Planctomicrobium sp. SH527]|uniref:glycosyltransferase family 2 protein n=1 Tax=Planctomicrobium sp. SH527 TaxID=3448123 RepID=UPI003F5C6406